MMGKLCESGVIQIKAKLSPQEKTSTLVHEGTHYYDLGKGAILLRDLHLKIVGEQLIPYDTSWNKKQKSDFDYIGSPEEMHARVMALRWLAKFKPDHEVQSEELNQFLDQLNATGALTPGSPNFDSDIYDLTKITRDTEAIRNLLNLMI